MGDRPRIVDLGARKGGQGGGGNEPPKPRPPAKPEQDTTSANTDMRFAAKLGDWHRNELRYCAPWGVWLAWDGQRWERQPSRVGKEQEAAKKTARRLMREAQELAQRLGADMTRLSRQKTADGGPTPAYLEAEAALEKALATVKGVRRAQSATAIRDMLRLASSDPRLAVYPDALDSWPWELNVGNGTVDLRNGTLLPHNPESLHTKVAPVIFDPDAMSPRWGAFLQEVMAGSDEMVRYLQKLAGYGLTGSTREHALHFHFGGGQNGKSTFLGTLLKIAGIGEYATMAARNLLFQSKGTQHDTRFAALHGARMVWCNEIEEGLQFDESLVKDLCSDDPINCRRMREDPWNFLPTHKLHVAGQHKPHVQGEDDGIWRRMRLVPWTVKIPEAKKDKKLGEKLWAEREGILAWAVRGAVLWQKEGLEPPAPIVEATQEYRETSDIAGQFVREMVLADPKGAVPVAGMREAYEKFCKDLGAKPLGAQRFNGRLRGAGAKPGSARPEGVKVKAWIGVRLL